MKSKLLLCLALILSGGLFGCATAHYSADSSANDIENIGPKLPIQFKNYCELYAFILARTWNGMPTNEDTMLAMASDSETEIATLDGRKMPYVFVITPHFLDGNVYDHIRGAQGNGDYYILRPLAKQSDYTGDGKNYGFELIGIGEGNTLEWTNWNGKTAFINTWHVSAGEHATTIHVWNGKIFEVATNFDSRDMEDAPSDNPH